jgi:hypothetical protein
MRQNRNLERRSVSIGTEKALVCAFSFSAQDFHCKSTGDIRKPEHYQYPESENS